MVKCAKPIAVRCGDGIHRIVPCGQCICCRLNRVRDWTLRLMHEAQLHQKSVFVTLTYANEYLPAGGSLVKKDLQDYLKRLRKRLELTTGEKIRYFACGEYGEKFERCHFHLILYGIDMNHEVFKGKKYDRVHHGYYLTTDTVWKKGNIYLGDVTYKSARYVASYVNKKYFGKKAKIYEEKGVIPEFTLMSRRPGIGFEFVNFIRHAYKRLKLCILTAKKQKCQDITKIKYLTLTNLNFRESVKNKILLKRLTKRKCGRITIHLPTKINC